MDWTYPPEPVTWTLPVAIALGSATYSTVTLRAPTAGDVMKATAVSGASSTDVALRLISTVSAEAVPHEALQKVPAYLIEQMSNYLDCFGGAPLPGPLDEWRRGSKAPGN